jgi:kynurenine formamidase
MTGSVPTDLAGLKALGKTLSNWGRWGAEDEAGTLNFVTPEVRAAAARLIVTGNVIDLGMAFGAGGPLNGTGTSRFNPIHLMSWAPLDPREDDLIAADDVIVMGLQSASQWDGLAHVGYDGRFYNDVPASAVTTRHGALRNSFAALNDRLISRGVLLDLPRLHGVDALAESTEITADDLDAAADMGNVQVRSGDIVLVRTGCYQHFLAGDHKRYLGPEPGLGLSTLRWLHDREVAAVASDNYGVEVQPGSIDGCAIPFHMVAIRDMGMLMGEMFNLETLAAGCAEDGVYDFFFSGIGLKVTNAVGGAVTPVAIK